MYEQNIQLWDIAVVAIVVLIAGFYVYKKIIKKKPGCGGGEGCDSCASSIKKPRD